VYPLLATGNFNSPKHCLCPQVEALLQKAFDFQLVKLVYEFPLKFLHVLTNSQPMLNIDNEKRLSQRDKEPSGHHVH
jgi:hypothetical protein